MRRSDTLTKPSRATPAVRTNNVGVSARTLAVDIPILQLGSPQSATIFAGTWNYYRFDAQPGNTVLFSLAGDSGSGRLYVRRGQAPTLGAYDATSSAGSSGQEARLLDPNTDVTYDQVSSGSTASERWEAAAQPAFTVAGSGPLSATYFDQLPETLSAGTAAGGTTMSATNYIMANYTQFGGGHVFLHRFLPVTSRTSILRTPASRHSGSASLVCFRRENRSDCSI